MGNRTTKRHFRSVKAIGAGNKGNNRKAAKGRGRGKSKTTITFDIFVNVKQEGEFPKSRLNMKSPHIVVKNGQKGKAKGGKGGRKKKRR